MKTKIVYQTDHLGIYVGEVTASESPLEPGIFMIPGGCVENPPPEIPDSKAAWWNTEAWQLVDYLDGVVAYRTESGEPRTLRGFEPLPSGYTLKKPGPDQIWKNGEWVDDLNALLNALYPRKMEALHRAYEEYSTSGFYTDILGERYRYDTGLEDQVALTGLVLNDEEQEYPCYAFGQPKTYLPHTADQLRLLGKAMFLFKRSTQQTLDSLIRELDQALADKDLNALRKIEWSLSA